LIAVGEVACVLLAAGASRRLGFPKQLLRLNGETLLHRTARLALLVGVNPMYVVLGSRADELRNELSDLPVDVIVNADWETGMASSLKAGIEYMREADQSPDCLLVLVCDQTGLTEGHLQRLLVESAVHQGRMVASGYGEKVGVPAIFPSTCFDDLMAIQGDGGARELLRQNTTEVIIVSFPEGALDIDTAQDAMKADLRIGP
jgi:molybdenum cofactor cytidylyltransferase